MRIKPAPGLSVRDPITKQLLPAEGIDVPDDSILWNKILGDGDVVRVDDAKSIATTGAPAASEGDKA